jgi:hypothetical protein
MSLFKKDYQEHFDFFAKCSDYIFTKHRMAQTGAMRFASASDILTFRALENIVLAESEDSINLRLSQIADEFSSLGTKIKRSLRNQYDIPRGMKFTEFRAQNKETDGFDEQRLSIKAEIAKSRDFKKLTDALVMPLTSKVIAVAKARSGPRGDLFRRITMDEAEDAARSAVISFLTGTTTSSLADYLVDFPESKNIDDMVELYKSLVVGGPLQTEINKIIKEKVSSLDENIKGKDDSSTTRGEQLRSDSPSIEETVESKLVPTSFIRRLVQQMKMTSLVGKLDQIDESLSAKRALYQKRILSDDEMQQYMNLTEQINNDVESVSSTLINRMPEGEIKQNLIDVLGEQLPPIKQLYTIPGTETVEESIPEVVEQPEVEPEAVQGKRPRKKNTVEDPRGIADYLDFREKSRNYFESVVPHIYGSMDMHPAGSEMAQAKADTPRILRRRNDAIQYGEGINTREQEEAVISGDDDAMRAAGVPDMAIFNRKLMQIVHDLQADKIWEASGRPLPEATGSKDANDKYNKALEALRVEFANSPEVQARINVLIRPKGQAGGGLYQETFREFDKVRISGELTKMLSDLGLTSFGQIYPAGSEVPTGEKGFTLDSPEVQNALNNIVSEESHYGQGRSWVGPQRKEVTHDVEAFKRELTAYLNWLIDYANRGKPTTKNLPYWSASNLEQHGFTAPNVSMRGRQKRFKDETTPEVSETPESTQILPESAETEVKTTAFTSTLSDGPYDVNEFFYEHPKPKHHAKKKFKVTLKHK